MSEIIINYENTRTSLLSELTEDISSEVIKLLEKVDDFNFNVFSLDFLIQKRTLYYVLTHILKKYNFFKNLLSELNYINFMNEICNGYDRNVVFHNDLHGADVLQTTYILISKGDLVNVNFCY